MPVMFAQSSMTLVLIIPQVLIGLVLVAPVILNPWIRQETADRLRASFRRHPGRSIISWLIVLALIAGGGWWLLRPTQAAVTTDAAVLCADAWYTFGGGPERRGARSSDDAPGEISGRLCWQFHDALILEWRPFASSPAVAASRVVIGSDNYKVYCLDLDDNGTQRWTFEARWPVFSSPVISEGRVYVGEGLHEHADCKLYCLDLATGKKIWERQTTSHTESTPTVMDGKVYFGAGDDGVLCCDARTGDLLWQFGDPHVDCCPLVVDGKVFFGSGYGFQGVYCVDARTGDLLWKREMPAPVWGAPSFANERLYVGVGNGSFVESAEVPFGEARCLDPADGSDLWRFTDPKDGVLTSVAICANTAVFGSRDGVLYAVDAGTGKRLWHVDVEMPILSTPAVVGGQVFFGCDDGIFRCVRLDDGKPLWSYDTTDDLFLTAMDPRIQSSPAVVDGKVIFGAANGNVYCLGASETAEPVVVRSQHPSRLMRATDAAVTGTLDRLFNWTGSLGVSLLVTAFLLVVVLLPLGAFQWVQLARMEEPASARPSVHPLAIVGVALVRAAVFVVVLLVVQSTYLLAGKGFLWMNDLSPADGARPFTWVPWVGKGLSPLALVTFVSLWFSLTIAVRPETRRDPARQLGLILLSAGLTWLVCDWSAGALIFVIVFFLLDGIQQAALQFLRRRKEASAA